MFLYEFLDRFSIFVKNVIGTLRSITSNLYIAPYSIYFTTSILLIHKHEREAFLSFNCHLKF